MASESSAVPLVMKAWQYKKFGGGADDLQLSSDVAVPRPKAGEVLIKVEAVAINPVDWKFQKGIARPLFPALPCIPGLDVSGEVIELGPGVDTLSKGDHIFGDTEFLPQGALAEYAVVPVKGVAVRPPTLGAPEAACLGVAGITALQALRDYGNIPIPIPTKAGETVEAAKPQTPSNVLITNAAGGVGHYAVQLARLAGAHVTATCGQRNIGRVKEWGADEVLDYKTPEGAALISPSGRKYDVVVDGTSSLTWKALAPVLSPTGKLVALTPNLSIILSLLYTRITFSNQKVLTMFGTVCKEDLSALGRLSSSGQLKTLIEHSVPFSNAPEAWRKSIEGHVTGKVVVLMD